MDARYPIGKYVHQPYSEGLKKEFLQELRMLPADLEMAILNLDEAQLDTSYREGGWSIKQVVHHIADSHINAYVRCKLALTEDKPTVKPYDENSWAELEDVKKVPLNVSLTLVHALHERWVAALRDLDEKGFERTIYHPEQKKELSIWYLLGMYVWHGKHHLAQIKTLRESKNW